MDGHLLRYNKNATYTFIDLETFNLCLHFNHNRPWQVGILQAKGDDIVSTKDIRVDWSKVAPHLKISKDAAQVTHFNQEEQNRLQIPPEEAFKLFWPALEKCDYIVMHNGLRFDIYLLKCYAEYMGVPWKFIVNKTIDTKSVAQGIEMSIPFIPKQDTFLEYQYRMANLVVKGVKTNLTYLAKKYNIPIDENRMHDAVYDLEINFAVWNKMKSQIEI